MSEFVNNIDGKAISEAILSELRDEVSKLKEQKKTPGLAVLLIGSRRDSQTYVRMKAKACEKVGIDASNGCNYPDTVTEEEVLNKIQELNKNPNVHGILVQLPLPPHLNESKILNSIDKEKDVDGLHPLNVASLCNTSTHIGLQKIDWKNLADVPFHIACTPQGCIELLDRSNIPIEGKRAIVIGRSNLVGLPVAMLLMHRNATVTIVHSRTQNVESVVKEGDIVVSAVGKAEFVKADWLKPGSIVVDVGINSIDDPNTKRGYRLVGDIDYDKAKDVASWITPVPGGVGPMTIVMLLRNTVNSCKRTIIDHK